PIRVSQLLTIRAGAGFRPVIKFQGEHLKVSQIDPFYTDLHATATLCLEGLELQRNAGTPGPKGAYVSLFWAKRLRVANCRFLASGVNTCVHGELGEVRNCEFIGTNDGSVNNFWRAGGQWVIDNCLLAGGVMSVTGPKSTKDVSVKCTRNTFRSKWGSLRLT